MKKMSREESLAYRTGKRVLVRVIARPHTDIELVKREVQLIPGVLDVTACDGILDWYTVGVDQAQVMNLEISAAQLSWCEHAERIAKSQPNT